MYRILKGRNEIVEIGVLDAKHESLDRERRLDEEGYPYFVNIDVANIDRNLIYGLEIIFPYSSPGALITDELTRITLIVNEAHEQVTNLLAPHSKKNSIEIKEVTESFPLLFKLFVNGAILEDPNINLSGGGLGGDWIISLENEAAVYRLSGNCFSDISEEIGAINIRFSSGLTPKRGLIRVSSESRIRVPKRHSQQNKVEKLAPFLGDFSITFFCSLDIDNWRGEHAPSEYIDELQRTFSAKQDTQLIQLYEVKDYKFNLVLRIDSHRRIVEEVFRCKTYLRELIEETENKLPPSFHPYSITSSFKLPKEVEVACEQYLLYFTQFLRDLGVNATSDIRHEAGQVLFTVTPTTEKEALDKIRTALEVYLHLPTSPISNDMGNEIAIQRLESQVLRFQSDLRLAAAELQAKNATIEAQQLTINVQKALLNREILLDPIKDVMPKADKEDREEFFDGAAALTVLKKEGFELNLPKIYRRLKEWITEK